MAKALIFQSWYENLQIFSLSNLKMFGLIVLKTVITGYKIILQNLWLIALWVLAVYVAVKLINIPSYFFYILNLYFWIFFLSLTLRSSIAIKDYKYYLKYFLKYGIQFLILATLNYYLDYNFFLLTFFIIWLNFIFDDQIDVKNIFYSFYRSGKLFLFNLPVLLITSITLFLIGYADYYLVSKMPVWFPVKLDIINYIIILPIFLAFIISFYIKRVHDQFLIYYS